MNDASLTNQALKAASVTGLFTLSGLCKWINLAPDDKRRRDAVWRSLAPVSDEHITPSGSYFWQISPDARRAALSQFYARAQLEQFMKQVQLDRNVVAADRFGLALSELLRGNRISFEDPGLTADIAALRIAVDRAAAILDAAQFARVVPALEGYQFRVRVSDRETYQNMDLDMLVLFADARIKDLQARSDIRIVVPYEHVGYTPQKRVISQHARGQDGDKPLLLTGIGGVGKSALLSRLMIGWRRSEPDMIQVLLDFDRRQLSLGEPIEILQEMFRQVSAFLRLHEGVDNNALREGLHDLRHEITLYKTNQDGTRASNSYQLSYALRLANQLSEPWAQPLVAMQMVVVLDTFEAIDRMAVFQRQFTDFAGDSYKGNEVVSQIIQLLERLRTQHLPNMHVIVSGREEPLNEAELDTWFGARVRLEGLSSRAGAKLLQAEAGRLDPATGAMFSSDKKSRQVSRLLGGHPLAVIAFARYADNNPSDVKDLIAELEAEGGFAAEFAQIFLYTRILNRITDPQVRNLAHPGLMLRVIDADIIQNVLAGPCLDRGQGTEEPLTKSEAENLFARLKNQYWLVNPVQGSATRVRHIPDLRRLMLPGLLAGPGTSNTGKERALKQDLKRRALKVCEAAARYFETRGQGNDALDALYYGAFSTNPPADFTKALAEELDRHLGEDVATMPVRWRGLIRHLLGQDVSTREAGALPDRFRQEALDRAISKDRQTGTRMFAKRRADTEPDAKVPPEVATADTEALWKKQSLSQQSYAVQLAWGDAKPGVFDLAVWFLQTSVGALNSRSPKNNLAPLAESVTSDPFGNGLYLSLLIRLTDHSPWTPTFDVPRPSTAKIALPLRHLLDGAAAAEQMDFDSAETHLKGYFQTVSEDHPVVGNRLIAERLIRHVSGDEPDETLQATLDFRGMSVAAGREKTIRQYLATRGAIKTQRGSFSYQFSFMPLWEEYEQSNLSLSILERFYKLDGALPINHAELSLMSAGQQAHFLTILRGLNPELYAPTIALLSALDFHKGEAVVLDTIRDLAMWPVDMQFDDQLLYSATDASAVVETADRCGALRVMLEKLAQHDPFAHRLIAIYDLITRVYFPGLEAFLSNANSTA